MPSSGKTKKLGLNQFVGLDKPKMEDFNRDNMRLEQVVGEHMEDLVAHLNAAQRDELINKGVVVGVYEGNGAQERVVELACTPTVGVIFSIGSPMAVANYSNPGQLFLYSGFFSKFGCSAGFSLTGKLLTVHQDSGTTIEPCVFSLNQVGEKYLYFAFR